MHAGQMVVNVIVRLRLGFQATYDERARNGKLRWRQSGCLQTSKGPEMTSHAVNAGTQTPRTKQPWAQRLGEINSHTTQHNIFAETCQTP